MAPTIDQCPPRKRIKCLPRLPELRATMARPGIGPSELARQLGRKRQHVQDVLGGRNTSQELAEAIAAFFGRPVHELFIVVDLENPDQASAA